jgi:hypothetical protein
MNMNKNKNNINITKNEYKDIIIDKRIIPLFKTPVILKKLSDKKKNKYNFKLTKKAKKSSFKKITFKEILNLFLKGIKLYKNLLSEYLNKHSNKIFILNLKNDVKFNKNLKLKTAISNFLYINHKFFPFFKIRSLFYNIRLFFPK